MFRLIKHFDGRLWAVCLSALALWACSDSGGGGGQAEPEVSCQTSADCDGGLCILGVCRACFDDAACERDYGVGATCGDGACTSCQGEEGCGCLDGGQCADGLSCDGEGICQGCPEGAEGCGCYSNNTCNEGLRCGDGALCETCPEGEEGCACGEGGACGVALTCMEDLCVPLDCEGGEFNCPCDEDERCDEGLTCSENGVCAECADGLEDCPCDEEGQCDDGLVCGDEDPDDDEPGKCREAVACEALSCVENQLCEEAQEGQDARCLQECAEGFVFNADTGLCEVLVVANCDAGADGSILEQCAAQSRDCVERGDGAACGDCLTGFTDEQGALEACRAVVACDALSCGDQNRTCDAPNPNADAVCGGCLMGFVEENGQCEPIPQANCQPGAPLSILLECQGLNRICLENDNGATCGGCEDGFGLDPNTDTCIQRLCADLDCADQGRQCAGEPLAECGGCLEGLQPNDPNDIEQGCRELLGCEDVECAEGEFCVESDDADASCQSWPCLGVDNEPDFRQVLRENDNTCVTCPENFTCNEDGETGDLWPFLSQEGRCICQTEPGYFYELGSQKATACDADGDGWVRDTARSFVESDDPALSDNARCEVNQIDRFVLENEYQQSMTVKYCLEGLVPAFSCEQDSDCELGRCNAGTCDCLDADVLPLYESVRNDDQNTLDRSSEFDVPTYDNQAGRGRRLRASELNPLTRACVSSSGDINDNGQTDILEFQGLEPENLSPEEADIITFLHFGYFVELHEGRFERTPGQDFGRYHISEKSRCDAGFPVKFEDDFDGDYWRSCTRNRDVNFDRLGDNPLIGYDFAQWGCQQGAGSCPLPPPLTDLTPDGEVPAHGLCDEEVTLPPTDGIWRGMNHHSLFKCVEITSDNDLADNRDIDAPYQRTLDEITRLDGIGGYQINVCNVACPFADSECEADCEDGQCEVSSVVRDGNPDLPVIECAPTPRELLDVGVVGFAAVRFIDSPGDYQRGCINEFDPDASDAVSEPWRNLCPGYSVNPEGVVGDGNPGNFGQVICGCGFNYHGANCDLGCPTDNLHFGGFNDGETCANGYCPVAPSENGGGRLGYWSCGDVSLTSYEGTNGLPSMSSSDWKMSGGVQPQGLEQGLLCEDDDDCNSGWSISP